MKAEVRSFRNLPKIRKADGAWVCVLNPGVGWGSNPLNAYADWEADFKVSEDEWASCGRGYVGLKEWCRTRVEQRLAKAVDGDG